VFILVSGPDIVGELDRGERRLGGVFSGEDERPGPITSGGKKISFCTQSSGCDVFMPD